MNEQMRIFCRKIGRISQVGIAEQKNIMSDVKTFLGGLNISILKNARGSQ
jgi:hypothetical protein